jgi:hypothetical protein
MISILLDLLQLSTDPLLPLQNGYSYALRS